MSFNKPAANDRLTAIHHPSIWLVVLTAGLLLGQAFAVIPQAIPLRVAFVVLLPLGFLVSSRTRRIGSLVLVAALAFSVGYVRHRQLLYPSFAPNHLCSVMQQDSSLYLEGVLSQEPQKLPNRTRWLLSSERIWHATGAEEISGNILVNVRGTRREWHYGDRVRFSVRPNIPRGNGNPGGFDYAAYLADREIYATGFLDNDGQVELVERAPDFLRGKVESLRREIRRFIDRNFSPDNGALLKALTVGDMGEIPKTMSFDFTAAGVNHVLSISGLHVSMLGLVIFAMVRFGLGLSSTLLLRWNLLKFATFCSFFAVVFYTALAGAMVPTVRSAIMIGVYELAVLLDREEEVLTSLTLAALLIALVWPSVITDISFQLSFLAVFFIAWGMRKVQEWLPRRAREELPQERSWWKHKVGKVGLQLAVPILATVGTAPLIAHYFGHLSLAGFLSNPVIVPLVGFVVVPLGLLIGFLALTFSAAAWPLVWVMEHLLSLTIWLVHLLAQLPLANIGVPSPNLLEVGGLYLFLLSILLIRTSRYAVVALVVVVGFLTVDGWYWWHERWNRKELRVTHLDVGHGDAAVVELPGSKVLLIDAGGAPTGEFDTGEAIVGPFLRSRKIVKVDYLMVSHPRIDHYGGMRSIVREFGPSEFWSGPGKGQTTRFEDLEEALEQSKIKRLILNNKEPCRAIDGVKLCVLHPPQDATEDGSVLLRLEFGKVRLLFAGDLDKREEQGLQGKTKELRSAVIKVPRHGGAASSTSEFVAAVQSRLAIFSVAARNRFGLPRDEVISRYREAGAEILRTDEDGAIIVETDGSTIRYAGYRSGRQGTINFNN
jgi:competence protein ComEC